MRTEYDVLVVGGGPGGAIAAKTIAEQGFHTCLIEKHPAIGSPVRCAEGIGKEALNEFIPPDEKWISAEITSAGIVAPDQTMMILDSAQVGSKVGYVLERKIFDRELVRQAAVAGADIRVKTCVTSPIISDGRVKGAYIEGDVSHINAPIVIAADGVESRFAQKCGISTQVQPGDMMSCAQYLLTDIEINPERNVFFLGNAVAPGGYLWIFPKGEKTANVGVGIQGSQSGTTHRAKDFLEAFIEKNLPNGKRLECIAGGVPVGRPLASTVSDGLLIVGDAARVVDPITGGGIYNALYTGRLAGETAIECLNKEDYRASALSAYDKGWRTTAFGKSLELNYKFREYFITLTDEKLNTLARSMSKLNMNEFSILTIVKELMIKNPKLLWDIRKLIPDIL